MGDERAFVALLHRGLGLADDAGNSPSVHGVIVRDGAGSSATVVARNLPLRGSVFLT